jgi:hypothetical protein
MLSITIPVGGSVALDDDEAAVAKAAIGRDASAGTADSRCRIFTQRGIIMQSI